jgi:hypothetical protein
VAVNKREELYLTGLIAIRELLEDQLICMRGSCVPEVNEEIQYTEMALGLCMRTLYCEIPFRCATGGLRLVVDNEAKTGGAATPPAVKTP